MSSSSPLLVESSQSFDFVQPCIPVVLWYRQSLVVIHNGPSSILQSGKSLSMMIPETSGFHPGGYLDVPLEIAPYVPNLQDMACREASFVDLHGCLRCVMGIGLWDGRKNKWFDQAMYVAAAIFAALVGLLPFQSPYYPEGFEQLCEQAQASRPPPPPPPPVLPSVPSPHLDHAEFLCEELCSDEQLQVKSIKESHPG